MPQEKKKRGRREEKKAKRKLDAEEQEPQHKRQKVDEGDEQEDFVEFPAPAQRNGDEHAEEQGHATEQGQQEHEYTHDDPDKPFFGFLDEAEQEYFKRADEMLELNTFPDPEERKLFLANVFREAQGKELKIANSQSCSRLMERLIALSSPTQLKTIFQKFSGNFIHLVQHRFASHCCEKLFTQAAPVVTKELKDPPISGSDDDQVYVSMENLFLYALGELEGNLGFLITDRFASHALRVLLLVLAGEPLAESKSLLQSKKKERVTVSGSHDGAEESVEKKHAVPKSFTEALQNIMSSSVAGLDTHGLRALATHPLGNPTLQLLVKLELTHFGKQTAKDTGSILRKLLPDEPIVPDCDSAIFFNSLLFDPVGSHLIETIVTHAPGKMFKALYRSLLKDRMASLARNEIAGFVVCRILERLSKDDLLAAHELILPTVPALLRRHRFAVVRTLMERCRVREVDTQALAVTLSEAYATEDGEFDIMKLLEPAESEAPDDSAASNLPTPPSSSGTNSAAKVQSALLAQQMLSIPGALSTLVFDGLVRLPSSTVVAMASDRTSSRTLQAALTSPNAGIISRRKLIQQLYGHVGALAAGTASSHVVDAVWEGSHGLAFMRERMAEELAENEAALRDSPCGRAVWKNWKMDLYKRRRGDWLRQCKLKAGNDGFQSLSELGGSAGAGSQEDSKGDGKRGRHGDGRGGTGPTTKSAPAGPEGKKSAIQLAQERHAAAKNRRQEQEARSG